MNLMTSACVVVLTTVLGQGGGFRDFSALPEVPFEATTFEQDALIEQASGMRGDNVEAEPVAACDALIADETLVFELRCWAVRQKMKLCTYARREWEALETGRTWVAEHGNDEGFDPLPLRLAMTNIVATRGHENFIPLYADVKPVFDDLFSNHPSEGFDMADAHLAYSNILGKLARTKPELHYEAVEHLGKALDTMERALAEMNSSMERKLAERGDDDEMAGTYAWVRSYFAGRVASVRSAYERGLAMQPSTTPRMTEEEYIKEIKDYAEGRRLVHQQRSEQGIEDSDSLGDSNTETSKALQEQKNAQLLPAENSDEPVSAKPAAEATAPVTETRTADGIPEGDQDITVVAASTASEKTQASALFRHPITIVVVIGVALLAVICIAIFVYRRKSGVSDGGTI